MGIDQYKRQPLPVGFTFERVSRLEFTFRFEKPVSVEAEIQRLTVLENGKNSSELIGTQQQRLANATKTFVKYNPNNGNDTGRTYTYEDVTTMLWNLAHHLMKTRDDGLERDALLREQAAAAEAAGEADVGHDSP